MTAARQTPAPKVSARQAMPRHHSTDKTPQTREEKIDAQIKGTFPASDPPSFSGGNHAIDAPMGRESQLPAPDPHIIAKSRKADEDQ